MCVKSVKASIIAWEYLHDWSFEKSHQQICGADSPLVDSPVVEETTTSKRYKALTAS
jgi:hypothetical protein